MVDHHFLSSKMYTPFSDIPKYHIIIEWASARVPPTPPSVGCNPGTANADGQRAWWQLLRGMWRVLRVLSV